MVERNLLLAHAANTKLKKCDPHVEPPSERKKAAL
jgi:hypothetical protein